ncbi:MAG: YkgJ family cysteine cluster protein [archaeon]
MELKNLSLLSYCVPCGAKCCKPKANSASPILSEKEVLRIEKYCKKKFGKNVDAFERVVVGKESYFVFADVTGGNCPFLDSDLHCIIHAVKPLDCSSYPIVAIYSGTGKIEFIFDDACPAFASLSKEFFAKAKKIALKSVKSFSKEVYADWLKKSHKRNISPMRK